MTAATSSLRRYPVRKPLAAFSAGAAVALLAGLIGLGGAEFRLPVLMLVFALYAHRAVRINLLISLATLAAASVVRLQLIPETQVFEYLPEILAMSLAGIVAAWVGAGVLERIPKDRILPVIAILLALIASFLLAETLLQDAGGQLDLRSSAYGAGPGLRRRCWCPQQPAGRCRRRVHHSDPGAGVWCRHRTAGTASVLISLPIVLAGVTRHYLAGKFRSATMLGYLVLPMSLGSVAGAVVGGDVSALVSQDGIAPRAWRASCSLRRGSCGASVLQRLPPEERTRRDRRCPAGVYQR